MTDYKNLIEDMQRLRREIFDMELRLDQAKDQETRFRLWGIINESGRSLNPSPLEKRDALFEEVGIPPTAEWQLSFEDRGAKNIASFIVKW